MQDEGSTSDGRLLWKCEAREDTTTTTTTTTTFKNFEDPNRENLVVFAIGNESTSSYLHCMSRKATTSLAMIDRLIIALCQSFEPIYLWPR